MGEAALAVTAPQLAQIPASDWRWTPASPPMCAWHLFKDAEDDAKAMARLEDALFG
jgi:hypothetical protein